MYMARSSLTYILGSFVKFFYQPMCTYYENEAYFDKKITLQSYPLKPLNQIKPNLGWGDPLSKLCWTAPPSSQDGGRY